MENPWRKYFKGVGIILALRSAQIVGRVPIVGMPISTRIECLAMRGMFNMLMEKAREKPQFRELETQMETIMKDGD